MERKTTQIKAVLAGPGWEGSGRYLTKTYRLKGGGGCAHASSTIERVIKDTNTRLIWQGNYLPNVTWRQAYFYCEGLRWGGKTDWTLPTSRQLLTFSQHVETEARYVWSYTSRDGSGPIPDTYRRIYGDSAYTAKAIKGLVAVDHYRHNRFDVRCVRSDH